MPIYEYQCKKCEGVFEILQGFNDKPAMKCEECGGRLKKIISLSAFHLKGAGWYETDYGKKKISEPTQLKDNAPLEKQLQIRPHLLKVLRSRRKPALPTPPRSIIQ